MVVAAALITASVFAGFVFSSETVVNSMGFALAAGVLIDAFLIRMLVGPALMSLLDRLLPLVDGEGERLTSSLAGDEAKVLEPASKGRLRFWLA